MKRYIIALFVVVSLFGISISSFADASYKDYEIEEIDMKGNYFEGVTGDFIVYCQLKDSSSSSYITIKKYGIRNVSGSVDTGPVFDKIDPFSEGFAAVYQYDEWGNIKVGYVDQTGKVVIKPKYDSAQRYVDTEYIENLGDQSPKFKDGRALVKYNGKLCYIDKKGNVVITTNYIDAHAFSDGLARVVVKVTEKYSTTSYTGYINTAGKVVIKPSYTMAHDFKYGVALVANVKFGSSKNVIDVIDKTGKTVFNLDFQQYTYYSPTFEDGLILVRRDDGKFGYMNTKGKMQIDYKFVEANEFCNGLAKVAMMNDGERAFGYINTKGEVVVKPLSLYNFINDTFSDGYISFFESMKYGLIDKKGVIVLESVFTSEPTPIANGFVVTYDIGQNYESDVRIGFVKAK